MLPQRYVLILATFSLSLLLYVDRICISSAKDEISHELSLDDQQMGQVLSSFALGYALLQAPGGMLADRFGPRIVLAGIVIFWSIFTGLTATVTGLLPLLIVRFVFGAGEAGAFPGIARATYSWIPIHERGFLQGINFSGARIGGALALVGMPLLIGSFGWRGSFVLLMGVGFVWAIVWFLWFRDDPADHRGVSESELKYIEEHRTAVRPLDEGSVANAPDSADQDAIPGSGRIRWLLAFQYFSSNFTFFFFLSWLSPHMKKHFQMSGAAAGWYSAIPLIFGALGNWIAGWLVDRIYRSGHRNASRQFPAILGFVLSAIGMIGSSFAERPTASVFWFSLVVLGADMTISPSWACCIDIGGKRSGVVSGTMNMAGNIGSFLTALAFPYMLKWTHSHLPYFYVGAGLSVLSAFSWLGIQTQRKRELKS